MKTIFKYSLEITDTQIIRIPKKSKILSVQTQNGIPCIWALVETNEEPVDRKIAVIGTGNPFWLKEYDFLGTIQTRQGALVWHIFEYYGE
jgi:hypothetical protein